jgi:hypothetical protein
VEFFGLPIWLTLRHHGAPTKVEEVAVGLVLLGQAPHRPQKVDPNRIPIQNSSPSYVLPKKMPFFHMFAEPKWTVNYSQNGYGVRSVHVWK